MTTESWDGAIERRVQPRADRRQRWTRRKGDCPPEGPSGVFVLVVGIAVGAVLTMFWAAIISVIQSLLG